MTQPYPPPELREIFERMERAFQDFIDAMAAYNAKHGHPPSRPVDRGDPEAQKVIAALDKMRTVEQERDAALGRHSLGNK